MMPIVWKYSYRFGASAFLFVYTLWVPMSARADAGTAEDLTQVRTLAERGSIRDEIVLAGDYFMGKGVKQDPKMAAYWYEKAAGHGNPEAQNQIGYFYQAGIGVPQDSEACAPLVSTLSVLGLCQSQGQFGDRLSARDGCSKERRSCSAVADPGLSGRQRHGGHLSWRFLLLRRGRERGQDCRGEVVRISVEAA